MSEMKKVLDQYERTAALEVDKDKGEIVNALLLGLDDQVQQGEWVTNNDNTLETGDWDIRGDKGVLDMKVYPADGSEPYDVEVTIFVDIRKK